MDVLWAQKAAPSWQPVWKAETYLHREEMNSTNNHISLEQHPKLPLRREIPIFREEFSLTETLIMGVTLTEGTHTHEKHIWVHAQSSPTLWKPMDLGLLHWQKYSLPSELLGKCVCVCVCVSVHVYWPTLDSWVWKIPWGREWKYTPVFLPGESHGQRGLAGYSPWGHKESDRTEQLTLPLIYIYIYIYIHQVL